MLSPSSAETLIQYYLKPVFDWTAFSPDAGIPYLNFNDCAHLSLNSSLSTPA